MRSCLLDSTPSRGSLTRLAQAQPRTRWRSSDRTTVADLASVSASGNTFGIQIDTVSLNESGYAKVKLIEGTRYRLVVRLFC